MPMMITPHSWNNAAIVFATTERIRNRLYPEPSCFDLELSLFSSRLPEPAETSGFDSKVACSFSRPPENIEERSDAVAER